MYKRQLLTRSLASARRISEVLDENIVLDSPEDAVEEVPDGSVEFEGVSFKYHSGAREYALSGVELHIPAGQTVGILGGTGSAKTTLVQLIPRLYDATEGTVRVGGRDVREYDLRALRDAVGIVLQMCIRDRLVGVPMYADIFGTIPVAEALLAKGAQLGTVLAFMMAVTTLSLPSMIMLRKAVKPRLLGLFIAICTGGIILIGYLFNVFQFYLISI